MLLRMGVADRYHEDRSWTLCPLRAILGEGYVSVYVPRSRTLYLVEGDAIDKPSLQVNRATNAGTPMAVSEAFQNAGSQAQVPTEPRMGDHKESPRFED